MNETSDRHGDETHSEGAIILRIQLMVGSWVARLLARLLQYRTSSRRALRPRAMTTDPKALTDEDVTRYLANRAGLLHKLLADRRTWQQARATFGPQSTLTVGWVNGDGQTQRACITRDFLFGHAAVLRAVTDDLMQCGPEGQRLARLLLGSPQQAPTGVNDSPPGVNG